MGMTSQLYNWFLLLALIIFVLHFISPHTNNRKSYLKDLDDLISQNRVFIEKTKFDINASCDVSKVMTSLYDPQIPLTSSILEHLRGCIVILYFRTPRCGSTAIWKLFNELANEAGFTSLKPNFGQTRPRWIKNLNTITTMGQPSVITSHHKAEDLNAELIKPAVMVNLIRHPIYHALSLFKFRKYGKRDTDGTHVARGCKIPFSEYILRHGVVGPCIREHYLGMRFLCGAFTNCTSSSVCLQQAKKNVETLYLTVGISENIPGFLLVLETLLPQFFQGALQTYVRQPGLYMMSSPDPLRNETITSEAMSHLNHVMSLDLELYHFVQQRCHMAMKKVLEYQSKNTANHRNNRILEA